MVDVYRDPGALVRGPTEGGGRAQPGSRCQDCPPDCGRGRGGRDGAERPAGVRTRPACSASSAIS